jgi:hypothetical protein
MFLQGFRIQGLKTTTSAAEAFAGLQDLEFKDYYKCCRGFCMPKDCRSKAGRKGRRSTHLSSPQ